MTPAEVREQWRADGLRVCEYRLPFATARSASQWTSCPASAEPARRRSFMVRGHLVEHVLHQVDGQLPTGTVVPYRKGRVRA